MGLTAYLDATQRLLQNPVPATPLYTTAALTDYINEGRRQLAGDTECIRCYSSASLIAGQQIYPFSLFSTFSRPSVATGYINFTVNPSPGATATFNGVVWTFVASGAVGNQINIQGTAAFTVLQLQNALNASGSGSLTVATYFANTAVLEVTYKTVGIAGNSYTLAASAATVSGSTLTGGVTNISGISGVLAIRQLAVNVTSTTYKTLFVRSWPWFNRYFVANGTAIAGALPTTWAQQAPGTGVGLIGVGPKPDSPYTVQADVVCTPSALVTNGDYDAIPAPFTDGVKFYAAYLAYLSSQRTTDANVMFQRYAEYARRSIEQSQPSVYPQNFPGGMGARMVASKQALTAPQPQQGQR